MFKPIILLNVTLNLVDHDLKSCRLHVRLFIKISSSVVRFVVDTVKLVLDVSTSCIMN